MAEKELKPRPNKLKILFISQEMTPYTPASDLATISRNLPQAIQERGKEIRIMMPKYGLINERSNQLHEVYRLSTSTIQVNDDEKPLLIKVGAITTAKIQTYFIDNEELFKRKHIIRDENNVFFKDNDERIIFFCKGVLEIVKQLNWSPDIIHCQGWMASLIPLLIKTTYKKDPLFSNSKVIYTLYDDHFSESLDKDYHKKLTLDGIPEKETTELAEPTFENISRNAISKADGVIIGSPHVQPAILKYANTYQVPLLTYQLSENFIDAVNGFYEVLSAKLV